ncbi:MAG TPA: hypothetical protein VIA06_07525 [Candidatus Dormibacteraeota bacterium]|nr:hypothetical protein [Candidatus Dormibacteraeota bacterium]
MAEITDETMRSALATVRGYTVVLLKDGPNRHMDGVERIVWEHGRRNFSHRADGLLSIVCPVADDTSLCGVGIYDADPDRVRELMEEDPGVRAGVFTYEIHPVRSFPGDTLPT